MEKATLGFCLCKNIGMANFEAFHKPLFLNSALCPPTSPFCQVRDEANIHDTLRTWKCYSDKTSPQQTTGKASLWGQGGHYCATTGASWISPIVILAMILHDKAQFLIFLACFANKYLL